MLYATQNEYYNVIEWCITLALLRQLGYYYLCKTGLKPPELLE